MSMNLTSGSQLGGTYTIGSVNVHPQYCLTLTKNFTIIPSTQACDGGPGYGGSIWQVSAAVDAPYEIKSIQQDAVYFMGANGSTVVPQMTPFYWNIIASDLGYGSIQLQGNTSSSNLCITLETSVDSESGNGEGVANLETCTNATVTDINSTSTQLFVMK